MPKLITPFIDLKSQYKALKPQIQNRVNKVLEHGQYIMGPEVGELEERLAAYTGARHCITVSSGTEALLISLMALGIGPGDEVITTPFTFAATVEVIVLLGAKPIYADVEVDTCNIDASKVEALITPRTKAIIPVSLYGQPSDMSEINTIALRHDNIPVIEDAAQSFGAVYKNKKSCNLSTIGCTSFFPSKPLGCYGDGGAIFTSDNKIAKVMREIRIHGQSKRYLHGRVGVGGRMDTIQCAILLAKLDNFEWDLEQRRKKVEIYRDLFSRSPIEIVSSREDRYSACAQFTILVKNRSKVQKFLSDHGIASTVHYPIPMHLQPAYREAVAIRLPNAEHVAKRVLSLPLHSYLKKSTQKFIQTKILECI